MEKMVAVYRLDTHKERESVSAGCTVCRDVPNGPEDDEKNVSVIL